MSLVRCCSAAFDGGGVGASNFLEGGIGVRRLALNASLVSPLGSRERRDLLMIGCC